MAQPPERYPVKEITEAIDFLQLIKDSSASNLVIGEEFFTLVADFGNGVITDARAVVTRANELLQGHPGLVDRFQGFLDPEAKARAFLERAKQTDTKVYDDLLAELRRVDEERGLDAHAVYGRLRLVLGSANGDLLRGFAAFLPSRYDPPPPLPPPPPPCAKAEREERRAKVKRKRASSEAGVDAGERSRASRAKRPHVGDGPTPKRNPAASYADDAGAAGNSRRSRGEKPRVDDGPAPRRNPVSCADAVAAGSSRPSRGKKPRADDSENYRRAPLGGAVNNDTGRGAAARDDDEVKRFREAWEFETGYSKLVATMTRVEELQSARASGSRRRPGASLEELFPSRESREYLADMYHDEWKQMRKMLEEGDHIGFALEIILDSLREKEAAAVEEARSRQDPIRAAERLDEKMCLRDP